MPHHYLLLLFIFSLFHFTTSSSSSCPYNITGAARMIPKECYANATNPTATSCCWFIFASYIYAAAVHSNQTGVAFLDSSSASSCSSTFTSTLLKQGLARPDLLLPNGSCSLLSSDSPSLAAGKRSCLYGSLSSLLSAAPVQLSNATSFCAAKSVPDLSSNQSACSTCQNNVIQATFTLLNFSKSKDYVACGMAATVGVWSRSFPSMTKFRSYALCMVQILENVNSLGIPDSNSSAPGESTTELELPGQNRDDHGRAVKVAVGSASVGLFSVVGIAILGLVFCRVRRSKMKSRRLSDGIPTTSDGDNSVYVGVFPLPTEGLYIFTKAELKQATDGFDNRLLLGEGGAGKVYLGKLPSGQHVAIKRIYREKKISEFYREVEILAKLRHKNLTTLVGYCLDDRENHALVYEYMQGGNLSRALFHGELTWQQRVQIGVNVAQGLVYLHEFPGGAIVHRDVKPTNILLTESGVAKLSDFGVSRTVPNDGTHLSTEVRGTMGYVDPESLSLGCISESSDVYSFGIVLLELVTGKHSVIPTPSGGAESIVHVAHSMVTQGGDGEDFTTVGSIVDPRLGPSWDLSTVSWVFAMAYQCVRPYKNDRPKMAEVLAVLKTALADLEAREGDLAPSDSSTEESSLSHTSTPSS